jgi:hypothetical protein
MSMRLALDENEEEAMGTRTTWNNELILESKLEYGMVGHARTGINVHVLRSKYVVGIVEGFTPKPNTIGAQFLRSGKPVLFSCGAWCNMNGQRVGCPLGSFDDNDGKIDFSKITCKKCGGGAK